MSVKSTSKISNTGGCAYISIKGKNAGKICGIKPKDGGLYCGTHKKYEGKQPREKKIIPEPKKSSSSSPKPDASQRIFRKYKGLTHLYHPQTNLVIKSPTDRYVIGKIVNDKIEKLTDEDIELCKQWGFPLESKKAESPKEEETKTEKPLDSPKEEEKKPEKQPKKPVKRVIDSSDDEEEKKPEKPLESPPKKPVKRVIDSSDDEDEKKPKKPVKKVESEDSRKDTEDYINDLADDTSNVVKALGLEEDELEDE
jgi:hypothetical protein